jgi:hypothetical protein
MKFLQLFTNKLNSIKTNQKQMEQKTETNQNVITQDHLKLGAYEVKNKLKAKFSLDYLKAIEENIANDSNISDLERKSNTILNIGSFYGQLLIERFGGQWIVDSQIDKCTVLICNKFIEVNPFDVVKRFIKFGSDNSIVSHYISTNMMKNIRS